MTLRIGTLPSNIARNPYRYNYQLVTLKQNRAKLLGHARYLPKKLKKAIFKRDNCTCQICGDPAEQIDHINPWRISHDNSPENLRAVCHLCNTRRRLPRRDARPNMTEFFKQIEQELKPEYKNTRQAVMVLEACRVEA